jgi:hypothetical protein
MKADTLPAKLNEFTGSQLFDNKVGQLRDVVQMIRDEVTSIVPDTSSKKGRDAIASNAYRIARSKTYIDAEGKKKTAALREEVKRIDDLRKFARDELDALKTEIRGPLDDWEQVQEQIEAERKARLAEIEGIRWPTEVEEIRAQLEELESRVLVPEDFGPHIDRAINSLGFAIKGGRTALADAEEIEEKRVEAERLRAELAAMREKAEALELEKREREAAERAKKDKAEEAKRKRAEAKERKEREARIAREAAERATREAEERARAEAERAERERQAAEDARIAREAAEAEIERQRAEDEANVERVEGEIVEAISIVISTVPFSVPDGVDGEIHAGQSILAAIKAGDIPHVSIDY